MDGLALEEPPLLQTPVLRHVETDSDSQFSAMIQTQAMEMAAIRVAT